jgi:hypothetical protein
MWNAGCISYISALRNFWFLDFIHRPVFGGTLRFGNWICFRPQVTIVTTLQKLSVL